MKNYWHSLSPLGVKIISGLLAIIATLIIYYLAFYRKGEVDIRQYEKVPTEKIQRVFT